MNAEEIREAAHASASMLDGFDNKTAVTEAWIDGFRAALAAVRLQLRSDGTAEGLLRLSASPRFLDAIIADVDAQVGELEKAQEAQP